jgi:hypothetical protein
MPNNILITPGSASIDFSGSMAGNTLANTLRLQVLSDASVVITGSVGQIARFFPSGQVWVTSSAQSSIAAHQFTGSLGIVSFIGTASRVENGVYTVENQTIAGVKTFSDSIAFSNTGVINAINLGNNDIIGVNNITINDPGVNEGIAWAGGNLWRIYESPNALTNAAGNLQIVQNTTRRATFNTSGQLEIPIATGTAPFIVASTTVVTNLNADLLDGYNTAVAATANTVVVRDANGGITGSLFGNASSATTASYVAWPNVGLGTRTNYDLDFKPLTSNYAGFRFSKSTSANGAADAGYLLIRGTSDADVYTAEGITLVADAGWLTLAQRTTATRGVRIMTGTTTSAERALFLTDGTVQYTGQTFQYTNSNQVLFDHTSNNTNVPFTLRKSGTSFSDGGDYGVLYLSRTNHNNSSTSVGATLYFELKDSGGTLREYAGIGGRKTVAGADGGALYFYRYARTVMGYWDVNGLYAPVFYDSNNSVYYVDGNGTSNFNAVQFVNGKVYSSNNASGNSFEWYIRPDNNTTYVWRHIYGGSGTGFGTGVGGYGIYYGSNANYNVIYSPSGFATFPYSARSPIFYDSANTAFFLDLDAGKSLRIAGGIAQNNIVGRPVAYWGATSATGAVIIKFPGGTGNYGMIHAEIDIYEYSGNAAATIIVGGHNWNGAWYNINAEVVGQTDKQVRVGVKDGRYCIVIGDGSSSWSYGQVVLRKIQNGTYYDGVMEVAEGYSVAIESDSYSYISGDLRNLRTPLSFTAGTAIYAPIYYDSNDTNYFVNPRSNSRMSGLRLDGVDNQASGEDAILWINKPNNNDWGIIITGNLDYGADFRMASNATYALRVLGAGDERWRVRGDGMMMIRNTSPTITFRDTDNNTAFIHVNSNLFYILRGGVDVDHGNWATVNGYWPLVINLTNNNAEFGGNVYIVADAKYFGMNSTPTWGGNMGSGQGKLEYHSNRWYINAGSNSTEIARFRRGGTDVAYMTNGGELYVPIIYDSNNTTYYLNPASDGTRAGHFNGNIWINPKSESYGEGIAFLMPNQLTWGGIRWVRGVSNFTGAWAFGYFGNESNDNIGFHSGGTNGWRLDHSWNMTSIGSVRSPIFYDSNNTGYYVDPNGTTFLYSLILSGATYFRPQTWIQFDGIYGLYWPNNFGAHLYPNNGSTYTQLRIDGQKSGYDGMWLSYSAVNGMMYDSAGNGGVYREANGRWYFYYHIGNACMGVGTSATSSTYGIYVVKGGYFDGRVDGTIFYDANNNGYYVDPNGTTNIYAITDYTRRGAFNLGRMLTTRRDITGDSNYWTGAWGWGTSYGNWNTAWEGGFSSWDIWGTNTGHPQGSGYVHAQGIVSGQHYATAGGGQAYGWMIVGAGDATPNRYWARGKWGGGVSGWLEFVMSGSNPGYTLYAYIMYDANNTGYYIDPNNVSQLHYVLADNWFRAQGCTGFYFQTYGRGLWSPECEGNPYGHVATYDGGRNGWRGYGIGSRYTLMSTMGDNVGMHDSARGWIWYMSGAILYLYYASSERMSMQSYGVYVNNGVWAPIYYDHDTSFYFDGNGTTRWQGTDDYSKMRIGLTAKGNFRRNDYTGDTNYWVGSMGWGTTDLISVFTWGSGFFDTWSNPANQPAGTSHWTGVQAHHYVAGYNNGYGWQLVGGPISGAWWTSYWPNKRPWYKIAMYGLNEFSADFYASIYYDSQDTYWMVDPSAQSGNDKSIRVRGNISNSQYANDVYTPPGTLHIGRSDYNPYTSYASLWYALKFTHSNSNDGGRWQWSHHLGGCCMFSMFNYVYNNLTIGGPSIGWGYLHRVTVDIERTLTVQNLLSAEDVLILNQRSNPFYYSMVRIIFDSGNSGWEKFIVYSTQQGNITYLVYGNGSTYNQTGVYAVYSDISLKQDIIDTTSQWNDIRQLRIVKFKLKEEVKELGETAPYQIGLIAQEVEQVSPGLITETDIMEDYEEDEYNPQGVLTGNKIKKQRPSGVKLKAIKQSILYMKAVKALQEAMERIEVLEEEMRILKAG